MVKKQTKIDIVVPKYYNNKEPIESSLIQYLRDLLIGQCGGLSVSDSKGYWSSKGKIYIDENMVFSVVTKEIHEDFIKFIKEYITDELKQKEPFIIKSEVDLL